MSNLVRIEAEHPHDPSGDAMVINQWLSYEVESDMFTPADGFTMRVAPTAEYLKFFRDTGHNVRIYYGPNLIMTGIVESAPVNVGDHGPQIELTGRDLGSLLVDDAAPLLDLSNQTLQSVLTNLIQAHTADIPGIITDNSANRYGLVGKSPDYSQVRALRKQKAARGQAAQKKQAIRDAVNAASRAARRSSIATYPLYSTERSFKRQTKPGETVWSVIRRLTRATGMAAWMTADGWLCVGRPDYKQTPVGQLYVKIDGAGNTTDSNCLMTISPDIGNRYSDYLFLGQGRAHAKSTGKDLADFTSTARDPSKAFWWDSVQRRRRRISVKTARNIGSKAQLVRYARTMMEHAAVKAYNGVATAEGHAVYPGGPLWAVDTVVDVDFQPKAINAPHYVRRRQFTFDASAGEATNLTLMPCGIWLAELHDSLSDSAYWAKMRPLFARYAL